jgi:hypothetical protein
VEQCSQVRIFDSKISNSVQEMRWPRPSPRWIVSLP